MPHETVLLEGHILDALLLSKILDHIQRSGGRYEIMHLTVGQRREDPSRAKLFIEADNPETLQKLLVFARENGATLPEVLPVRLEPAPADGVFPEDFYTTTNLETWIRLPDREVRVDGEAMDLGIVVDSASASAQSVPMDAVRKGDRCVVGDEGIRVVPLAETERARPSDAFGFMRSEVSVEKPHHAVIEDLAAALRRTRDRGDRNLLVLGPAAVHTGAVPSVVSLIEKGVFHVLFGGNAVATHDIEAALYGTSLGVDPTRGRPVPGGHHHHLRAINTIRGAGGITAAVRKGLLRSGIFHAAVNRGLDIFLAGSIRDDGPLPDVCTDALEAKRSMRRLIAGVGVAVMVATALHSIATGNMLPARVRTYCVDINPETVTKLLDRGSSQAASVVMDCESFFRELDALL